MKANKILEHLLNGGTISNGGHRHKLDDDGDMCYITEFGTLVKVGVIDIVVEDCNIEP